MSNKLKKIILKISLAIVVFFVVIATLFLTPYIFRSRGLGIILNWIFFFILVPILLVLIGYTVYYFKKKKVYKSLNLMPKEHWTDEQQQKQIKLNKVINKAHKVIVVIIVFIVPVLLIAFFEIYGTILEINRAVLETNKGITDDLMTFDVYYLGAIVLLLVISTIIVGPKNKKTKIYMAVSALVIYAGVYLILNNLIWHNTSTSCQKQTDCIPYGCECCISSEEKEKIIKEEPFFLGCSDEIFTRCYRGHCQFR